jgi:hypothetical protein
MNVVDPLELRVTGAHECVSPFLANLGEVRRHGQQLFD